MIFLLTLLLKELHLLLEWFLILISKEEVPDQGDFWKLNWTSNIKLYGPGIWKYKSIEFESEYFGHLSLNCSKLLHLNSICP